VIRHFQARMPYGLVVRDIDNRRRESLKWPLMGHSRQAGESLPVVSALVLLGAVGFTLVAAYQWAGILGIFWWAPGNWQGHVWQGHVWQGHVWNTVLAIILWLVWFYG
jgi:hypothetical protein